MSEQATFGAGCFWCVEAVFRPLRGVTEAVSGYTGGQTVNPTYQQVCTGTTGHAEVIQVTFDPDVIGYSTLLDVFWHSHNPTALNRQGYDEGTQYRSVIYYHSPIQQQLALESKQAAEASGHWPQPLVTEISPLGAFYPAETYHQNYYNDNTAQPYCSAVIGPKMKKLRQQFAHLLVSS